MLDKEEYEINIDKIFLLSSDKQQLIINMIESLFLSLDNPDTSRHQKDSMFRIGVLKNTLINNEWLITKRDKNLNKILN